MDAKPVNVLLVEDDPDHAELVRFGLEDSQAAMRVRRVSDGQEALDYLFRRGPFAGPDPGARPHIVLLDLRLPKIDGLEVLKEVKTSPALRRIPVIVLTSSGAEKDIAAAYDHGANSYLVKPVDFSRFSRLMSDCGLYWLTCNRQSP